MAQVVDVAPLGEKGQVTIPKQILSHGKALSESSSITFQRRLRNEWKFKPQKNLLKKGTHEPFKTR